MYDWDTDTLRTFRKYAHAHAVTLQNRGHDICVWIETATDRTQPNGQVCYRR